MAEWLVEYGVLLSLALAVVAVGASSARSTGSTRSTTYAQASTAGPNGLLHDV